MKEHIYKNIGKYGLLVVGLFIILAIFVFNHYWSALGVNPKTSIMPEITRDYEEFKDYTTLLFSLISALGSVLSSLLIILFYGAWKEQHNKTVISAEAKKLWNILAILEKETMNLDTLYLSSGQIQSYVYFKSVPNLNEYTEDLIASYNNSYSELIYFIELAQEKNNEVHSNYYGSIHSYEKEFFDKIESNTTIEDIYDKENSFRDTLIDENKKVRKYLLQYILIK